jgi:hypothetical protein
MTDPTQESHERLMTRIELGRNDNRQQEESDSVSVCKMMMRY